MRALLAARARRSFAALLAAPVALVLAVLVPFAGMATLSAQPPPRTLEHPSRVRITPQAPSTLSLYLYGGLTTQAGVIINADGTLNASAVIGPGTITFTEWSDNGCSMGEVPVFSGTVWQCGAGGGGGGFLGFADGSAPTPGGYFASDTDTGLFRPTADTIAASVGGSEVLRLDSAGRLGLGVTSVQQKLHLYQASGQLAQRLERGDQETWDITVNTNLQFQHVEGVVTALTLEATSGFVGVLNTNPAYALDVTGDVQLSGTLRLTSGTVAGHLLPATADTYNLGSAALPWQFAWITQLNSLLFVEETAQLFGGYQIVGKQVGTFDAAVASAATTINLGETITPPAWIVVRSHTTAGIAATEYIRVVSLSAGTTYNVERDITGLHGTDPAWADGTPWLLLGTQGDGRVEVYSTSGIPRISIGINNDSASSAYHVTTNNPADFTELVRIGGLDGMPGAGTGNYGIYAGDSSEFLSFFGGNLTVSGEVRANAGYIGSGSGVVTIDSSGLDVGSSGRIKGGTGVTYSAGTGFFLGFNGGVPVARIGTTSEYVRWNGTGLEVAGGNFSAPSISAAAVTASRLSGGASAFNTGTGYWLDYNGGTPQFRIGTVSGNRMSWDGAELTLVTNRFTLDDDGLAVSLASSEALSNPFAYRWLGGSLGGNMYLQGYETGAARLLVLKNSVNSGSAGSITLSAIGGSTEDARLTVGADDVNNVSSVSFAVVTRTLGFEYDGSAWRFAPGTLSTNSIDLGGPGRRFRDIYFSEPTTGASGLFPLVTLNGRIMAKSNGYNGSIVVAGCTISVEFGLITGKAGGC